MVALDRQELFQEGLTTSAVEQVKLDFGIDVVSVAKMTHLISFLEDRYALGASGVGGLSISPRFNRRLTR